MGRVSLTNDRAYLAGRSRDTVRGRTVPSREALSWHNKCGRVGAKVEEELSHDVDTQQAVRAQFVVAEAHSNEEHCENEEASQLNGLSANSVNRRDGNPVPRNGASKHDNQVANSRLVKILICRRNVAGRVSNGAKNGSVVEGETIVSDIQEEPRKSRASEQQAVLWNGVVAHEVLEAGLGNLHLVGNLCSSDTCGLVNIGITTLSGDVVFRVLIGLLHIPLNIESVTGCLRNGKTVVESDTSRYGTEANQSTPHLIDGNGTDTSAVGDLGGRLQGLLEASSDDEHDDGGSELANTLHGEHGAHHGTSPLGRRKFGGDDGRQWVVTTDTDAHEHTPEDDGADNVDRGRGASESVGEGSDDDEHQLDTIHPLTTNLCKYVSRVYMKCE